MRHRLLVFSLTAACLTVLAFSQLAGAAQAPLAVARTAQGGTQPANGQRLFADPFGKYLALIVRPNLGPAVIWSNDSGQTWTEAVSLLNRNGVGLQSLPSVGVLSQDGQILHFGGRTANSRYVIYGAYWILRDASNNIINVGTDATHPGPSGVLGPGQLAWGLTMDDTLFGQRPSVVIQANGFPAFAWAYDTTGGANRSGIRFSRAACDPSLPGCWKTATGCTSEACGAVQLNSSTPPTAPPHYADHLGYIPGVDTISQVVLLRAPDVPGQTWSNELVLLYTVENQRTVYVSRATENGPNYNAWSAPYGLYTDVDNLANRNQNLSAAVDAGNNRIWFTYSVRANGGYSTVLADIDLAASSDTFWQSSRYQLFATSLAQSRQPNGPSVSFDRVDNQVYLFGALNGIIYRRWHVATGLGDSTNTVVSADASARGPSALDVAALGGEVPLVWQRQEANGIYATWFAQVGP